MSETQHSFVAFDERETAGGIKFLRANDKYADLVPAPGTFKIDFFLLHAIGKDISKRRTEKSKLAFLTGTVVREYIPDTSPERRRLGMAYRDGIMAMFRRRKDFFASRHDLESTEYPIDKGDQLRLI